MRQVLNHVTDTERAFAYRALWIARGFDTPLISFDQETTPLNAEYYAQRASAQVSSFLKGRLLVLMPMATPATRESTRQNRLPAGTSSRMPFMRAGEESSCKSHTTDEIRILRCGRMALCPLHPRRLLGIYLPSPETSNR